MKYEVPELPMQEEPEFGGKCRRITRMMCMEKKCKYRLPCGICELYERRCDHGKS